MGCSHTKSSTVDVQQQHQEKQNEMEIEAIEQFHQPASSNHSSFPSSLEMKQREMMEKPPQVFSRKHSLGTSSSPEVSTKNHPSKRHYRYASCSVAPSLALVNTNTAVITAPPPQRILE
jgi:hypothetical protein